jgi:hypothetical protein
MMRLIKFKVGLQHERCPDSGIALGWAKLLPLPRAGIELGGNPFPHFLHMQSGSARVSRIRPVQSAGKRILSDINTVGTFTLTMPDSLRTEDTFNQLRQPFTEVKLAILLRHTLMVFLKTQPKDND